VCVGLFEKPYPLELFNFSGYSTSSYFSNLGDKANYIVYIHASRGQIFIVYVDTAEANHVGVHKR